MNKATFQAYIFQLLFGAGLACLLPFLSLYLRYLGLTASQVGVVLGAKAAFNMIWAPCWTRCSTRFHKKRFVLMFSIFVLLGSFLLMMLIPPAKQELSNLQFCPEEYNSLNLTQKQGNLTESVQPSEFNGITEGSIGQDTSNEGSVKSEQPPVRVSTVPPNLNSALTSVPATETWHTESERSLQTDSRDFELDEETIDILTQYGISRDYLKQLSKPELMALIGKEIEKLNAQTEEGSLHPKPSGTRRKRYAKRAKKYKHTHKENDKETLTEEENLEDEEEAEENDIYDDETENLENKDEEEDEENDADNDETESLENDILRNDTTSFGATEPLTTPKPTNSSKSFMQGNIYDSLASLMNQIHRIPGKINVVIKNERIFAAVLCLVIVGEMFSAPAEKLADDVWFEFLDSTDALEKYGSHRMWACLGFALVPPVVTAIIDKTPCMLEFSHFSIHHIMIHFYSFGVLIGFSLLLSFCYPIYTSSDGKKVLQRRSRFCRGLKTLFNDVHASLYTVSVLVLGLLQGCLYTFLFWQVQDKGGTELIMGLALTAAYGGEFFMIGIQRWLVMKMSYPAAVTMGLFLLGARFVFYSFLWSPWLVLVGEGFHCFSATLMWAAVRNYPDFRLNPLVMDRSANSVLNALYQGFGLAPGCIVAGYVYEWVGVDILFQAASILATVWCVMFAVIHRCAKKPPKVRYAKLLQEDEDTLSDGSMEYDDDWLEVAMKHQH